MLDKVCFTIDKNGIIFNSCARDSLNATEVEIAYNPVMQMLVVHKADESNRSLRWTGEDNSMRRCGCKGFANALFDNMGWNLDYKYRLVGTSMVIDDEPVLVFTLHEPIRIVPITFEKEQQVKKTRSKGMRELLEAGFAPEDFQVPNSVSDIDLGNDTLNEKAKNAAKSRAIYYDNYTSASGVIHVDDLGDERFNPDVIRQIIQKERAPEEGWNYLRGMAVIHKCSFMIKPESLADSFGAEVYSTRPLPRFEGKIVEGTAYGWVQALTLPTRETVEETIRMLEEEMDERRE